MADTRTRSRTRWADLVAIVASVVALGNALWGPVIFSTMQRDLPQGDPGVGYNWLAFGLGGILGVLGLLLAQKWPRFAKIPLALGGLLLIAVPFAYQRQHPAPIAVSVVVGLALLLAAPFVGPMPAPRRTGERSAVR
jgi:peptidoglycan/LPS O-acetylase OafA/YrhL